MTTDVADVPDAETKDAARAVLDAAPPEAGPVEAGDCARKVVINEVMTHGATASTEFIELYNPSDCALPIGGFTIAYRSKSGAAGPELVSFDPGTDIASHAFLVIGSAAFDDAGVTTTSNMADDGQIALLDETGAKVDSVGWGETTGGFVEGTVAPGTPLAGSIGRKTDGLDTDDNAADFKTFATPTPGTLNSP